MARHTKTYATTITIDGWKVLFDHLSFNTAGELIENFWYFHLTLGQESGGGRVAFRTGWVPCDCTQGSAVNWISWRGGGYNLTKFGSPEPEQRAFTISYWRLFFFYTEECVQLFFFFKTWNPCANIFCTKMPSIFVVKFPPEQPPHQKAISPQVNSHYTHCSLPKLTIYIYPTYLNGACTVKQAIRPCLSVI